MYRVASSPLPQRPRGKKTKKAKGPRPEGFAAKRLRQSRWIVHRFCSTCSIERAGDPPRVIAPAPWPELNLEPFPETQTQRVAAWQAVGMAQQILPEREPCRPSGKRLSWGIIAEAGGVHVCTDPYLVPHPNHGEPQEPGISLPCSWSGFPMAANLSGRPEDGPCRVLFSVANFSHVVGPSVCISLAVD